MGVSAGIGGLHSQFNSTCIDRVKEQAANKKGFGLPKPFAVRKNPAA